MKPLCFIPVAFAVALPLAAAEQPDPTKISFFSEEVLPILETHCYKCHGAEDKLKGGLRLTSREGLLHGGELGAAYDAENPGASMFLEMISYKDDEHQMPPKSKLADAEIATLTKWIVEMSAIYDPAKEIHGELAQHGASHITEADFDYWAYRKVERPEPPKVASADAGANPIDAFVLAGLEEAGLEPNPKASRAVLARRAYYNLIGLPPTPEEVRAFVEDPRPDSEAWIALIDNLLGEIGVDISRADRLASSLTQPGPTRHKDGAQD